jgi:tetratricopeptide (TPR) repeat protein
MSLFKSLFGKGDPVVELGKLHARREWAALLAAAKRLDRDRLPAAVQAQVVAWVSEAGDQLAQLNLDEGEGAWRLGNDLKAREHLQLAQEQACSTALRERVAQRLAGLGAGVPALATAAAGEAAGCGSSCGPNCAPAPAAVAEMDELDATGRMELLLATLPDELAAEYAAAGAEFLQAWLAAQEGEDERALALFNAVPAGERGPLFFAERGVVLARAGQLQAAETDLRAALRAFPELFHPFDALVTLLALTRRHAELEQLLRHALAEGRFIGYCWARLAQIEAGRGNLDAAVAACATALAEGEIDPATIVQCAQLQEHAGRQAEAEALLAKLPSGGCGGGAHPVLAEFWLRHGQHLERALESFKGALRHEPDNPRWLLRIAQVYIAKGWKREAVAPIENLLRRGGLAAELQEEVQAAAEAVKT